MKHLLKLNLAICLMGTLANIAITPAHAADTKVIGTDRRTGGEAPGDRARMQSIKDGMSALRNIKQKPN